jgi:nucleoside-diphosphate-sugar epimerase
LQRRIAIGGATGFLGSYLCAWFLREGWEVVAVARDCREQGADGRVRRALTEIPDFRELPLERLQVLGWDLPDGPLPERARSLLAGAPFVNTIASLKHGEHHRAEILHTNVEGTRRLLEGLVSCRAGKLHHMSTAFVCGQASGELREREAVLEPAAFNNLYEESKAQAERLLLAQSDLAVDLLRPSIIVGSSRTGWAKNFTGYYALYAVLRAALEQTRAAFGGRSIDYLPLRLPGVPCACTDIVPVDYVAELTGRLVQADVEGRVPEGAGRILHLVSSQMRRTTAFFLESAQRHLVFTGAQFVPPSLISDPHPLERWCASRLRFNNAYTVRDYRFRDDCVKQRLGGRLPVGLDADAVVMDRINDFFARSLAASGAAEAPRMEPEKVAFLTKRLAEHPEFARRNEIERRLPASARPETADAAPAADRDSTLTW